MNKMNHFVPHQYSEKRHNEQNEQNESFCPPPIFWKKTKWTKWTKWIILSPTFIMKKDKINKMNNFVPHQYSKKGQNDQNEQNESFCPLPIFWKRTKWTKWTKWIILSPTNILKKDKMTKMNKMNHFVPHQYSEKRQNEQNEQNESFCPPPIFWKN